VSKKKASKRSPKAPRKSASADVAARTGPGKPSHEPTDQTRKQVEQLAATGTPQDDIAFLIGVDAKTLRKHYAKEIRAALVKANANIAGRLYNKAMAGDNTSMLFWLKCRAKWKEDGKEGEDDEPPEAVTVQRRTIDASEPDA
jgi:hypothetical protein